MIIISACLCARACRYNGTSCPNAEALALLKAGKALPVCPEMLGGLKTPRSPAEIVGGNGADVLAGKAFVRNRQGDNVTAAFIRGAEEVLRLCKLHGVTLALLKSNSPSCGCGQIYDGLFSGHLIPGNGITAELLISHGIEVKAL